MGADTHLCDSSPLALASPRTHASEEVQPQTIPSAAPVTGAWARTLAVRPNERFARGASVTPPPPQALTSDEQQQPLATKKAETGLAQQQLAEAPGAHDERHHDLDCGQRLSHLACR
jgi:hypothetical protein